MMVGAIGFEPTTYGTQNRRATKLRHAPTESVFSGDVGQRKERIELSAKEKCSLARPERGSLIQPRVAHLAARDHAQHLRQTTIDFQHH